ncbi:DEAD/DEAH box helicase [Alicyclobacillus tolerans]|uniref:Superfamily II DNA or RNA helicase n=1 Tax=Alicyclobacillus tolerans TaxID=90970 RepID=A0A1M6UG15_9BACL|nr:DEAD/DEAH box helicase [Alicyclobacillus montanus]SHK68008.1 Superfamily II DNA or RNA helicase [Alicyclobacillus montanus]
MNGIRLRPYQVEAVEAFFRDLPEHSRQLMVLPTGAGKTIVFGEIARRYSEQTRTDKPVLVLAHRTELLDQAEEKIRMVWPEVVVGRIQGQQNEQLAQVLVASTQTLVMGRAVREPSLVIYDECHHSRADGAVQVLKRLGVFEPNGPKLLGVTATPKRADKHELGDIFEHLTYERTILDMIVDGYLSDVRGQKVVIPDLHLGHIRTTAGDYNAKDLAKVMNQSGALDAVVDAVVEFADLRKSIVFAVDIAHAKALAKRFQDRGVAAAAVDGQMSVEERARVLQDFAANRLRVVVNCQILTEGFDQPDVDCVVIARPTRSQALYTQMIGRALRLHPNKRDALILDLVGASDDKSLQTFTKLVKSQKKQTKSVHALESEPREDQSVAQWIQEEIETQQAKTQAEERLVQAVNLFANRSRFRWQHIRRKDREVFAISFGEHRWAYLFQVDTHFWPVLELNGERFMPLHASALPLEYAQGVAEAFLDLLDTRLMEKEADWRALPITEKQSYMLEKYRIPHNKTWTRGMAADVLTERFARKRVKILVKNFQADKWREALQKPEVRVWLEKKLEMFRVYSEKQKHVG